jgi:uncharacterized LabA/DUF88 family protein
MRKVITYIDGFNLYQGIRSEFERKYLWLDLEKFSSSLITAPDCELQQVNYFTAKIRSNKSKQKRQNTYLEALETLEKVTITYGKYLFTERVCPACRYEYKCPSEKMTDVNIATSLLTDAFQNKFDVAYLISGDSDLTGPVSKIKELFPQKVIIVAFPPDRYSRDLANIATANFVIGKVKLSKNQLPDPVFSKSGYPLERPESWR